MAWGPAPPKVEWTFIFLPLIFHAVVGVLIIRSGISNTSSYRYVNNVLLHVATGHGLDCPVLHLLSRLSDARLVP